MNEYIKSLEHDFSFMENGFKIEEKRALNDYKAHDRESVKKLAFQAYGSAVYQVRMYAVFLFGYLSEDEDILAFMKDEVSKDDDWRVQEILAKSFDEFCRKKGYRNALLTIDEWMKSSNPIPEGQLQKVCGFGRADHISKRTPQKPLNDWPA